MAITGETRIVDLPEKVSLVPGDFFVVDNEDGATSKIPAAAVSGSATAGLVAEEYSNASTYAVGEYCIHVESGIPKFYKCTTAITTAEAWNSAHWTQTDAGSELTTANADIATLNSNLTASLTQTGLTTSNCTIEYGGYARIGNIVILNFRITTTATASQNSTLISGFPTYTTSGAVNNAVGVLAENISDHTYLDCYINKSGNLINALNVASGKTILLTGVYICS